MKVKASKNQHDVGVALQLAVEPFVQKLAKDLTVMLAEHADRVLTAAARGAIASLKAELDPVPIVESTIVATMEVRPKKSHKKRERNYKPDNYPQSRRARDDRSAAQANGSKPITCRKCGYIGGNARGCGTAHETLGAGAKQNGVTVADLKPPPCQQIGSVRANRGRSRRAPSRAIAMTRSLQLWN